MFSMSGSELTEREISQTSFLRCYDFAQHDICSLGSTAILLPKKLQTRLQNANKNTIEEVYNIIFYGITNQHKRPSQ